MGAEKTGVHRKFSANCAHHSFIGKPRRSRCQTSQPATAMSTYSTVQTGPNSQAGGLKEGLVRPAYHVARHRQPAEGEAGTQHENEEQYQGNISVHVQLPIDSS